MAETRAQIKGRHPDFVGWDSTGNKISAWINVTKQGEAYLSISGQDKKVVRLFRNKKKQVDEVAEAQETGRDEIIAELLEECTGVQVIP